MKSLLAVVKHNKTLACAFAVACVCMYMFCSCIVNRICDADQAMVLFYTSDGPEETLMDPLIVSGTRVVNRVINEVGDPDMRRRGYAIQFLGNGRYAAAIPILSRIALDESEATTVREDAIWAITAIDGKIGTDITK